MKAELGTRNELELLSACQNGDQTAFRALFDKFHERVLHLCIRLCGNVQEAEDITQEVFLRIHHKLDKFERKSEFKTWIYRVTLNLCMDRNRTIDRRAKYWSFKPFRHVSNALESQNFTNTRNVDAQIWGNEVQEILHKALMKVKPDWRNVLVLKDIEGLTYKEIAKIANCSEGTVCSRLNRGRKALRAALAGLGIDENYFRD